MNRAGFAIRLAALIIDAVALAVVYFVVNAIFKPRFNAADFESLDKLVAAAVAAARRVALFSSVIWLAYSATEIVKAASPGKMVLGLKIVGETGQDLTPAQLAKRWAVKWSPSLIGLLWAITGVGALYYLQSLAALAFFVGCFFALGQKRQALHDTIARTAIQQTGPGMLPPQFQQKLAMLQPTPAAATAVPPPPPPAPAAESQTAAAVPPPPPPAQAA